MAAVEIRKRRGFPQPQGNPNRHKIQANPIAMLSQRIADQQLLRLIRKWLKAGVLETDGTVTHPVTGSPQGGVMTPRTQKITSRSGPVARIRRRQITVSSSTGVGHGNGMSESNRVGADQDFLYRHVSL